MTILLLKAFETRCPAANIRYGNWYILQGQKNGTNILYANNFIKH